MRAHTFRERERERESRYTKKRERVVCWIVCCLGRESEKDRAERNEVTEKNA